MSQISLCQMMGNPSFGQERTWSTVKEDPHSQWRGMLEGVHPYLSARASLNAPLCRQKPNLWARRSASLKPPSHLPAPWLSCQEPGICSSAPLQILRPAHVVAVGPRTWRSFGPPSTHTSIHVAVPESASQRVRILAWRQYTPCLRWPPDYVNPGLPTLLAMQNGPC